MWKLTFNLLLATTLIIAFGCRPPEDETQYNIATFVSPLEGSSCSMEPSDEVDDSIEIENCGMQNGCQAVLDDSNKYLGCMPIPVPPVIDPVPPVAGDDDDYTPPPAGDDDDDYTPPPAGDDDDDYTPPSEDEDDEDERRNACSNPEKQNHKVLVCHDTSNPNKGTKHHTICIAKQASENAHKQSSHHEGRDYLGACTQQDLDQ